MPLILFSKHPKQLKDVLKNMVGPSPLPHLFCKTKCENGVPNIFFFLVGPVIFVLQTRNRVLKIGNKTGPKDFLFLLQFCFDYIISMCDQKALYGNIMLHSL